MIARLGQTFIDTRIFTQDELNAFADLSGDDNPIHVDPEFSARTRFGRTVAHGMLIYGVLCGFLSEHFPGFTQLEQNFVFPAPTFTGERIVIQAHVTEMITDRNRVRLSISMTNPSGAVVCEGNSLLVGRCS
jgi:acyl dehydratase